MFAKLKCRLFGHLRGKRVVNGCNQEYKVYACPRCGAQWQRKVSRAPA